MHGISTKSLSAKGIRNPQPHHSIKQNSTLLTKETRTVVHRTSKQSSFSQFHTTSKTCKDLPNKRFNSLQHGHISARSQFVLRSFATETKAAASATSAQPAPSTAPSTPPNPLDIPKWIGKQAMTTKMQELLKNGIAEMKQGLLVEAELTLNSALHLNARLHNSTPNMDKARSTLYLAYTFYHMKKYPEAERLYTAALAMLKDLEDTPSTEYAAALTHLAEVYALQEKYKEAVEQCKVAVPVVLQVFHTNKAKIASVYSNLSTYYASLKLQQEALSYAKQALDLFEETLGRHAAYTHTALLNYYKLLHEYGQQEQLKAVEQQWGSKHDAERAAFQSHATAAFAEKGNLLQNFENKWKDDPSLKRFDPPGFFLSKQFLRLESRDFKKFFRQLHPSSSSSALESSTQSEASSSTATPLNTSTAPPPPTTQSTAASSNSAAAAPPS